MISDFRNLLEDSGMWQWNPESSSWIERPHKESHIDLVMSGYPRSGNTFLNFAFERMYKLPSPPDNNHTVNTIKESKKVFVPFRFPLDCISSWAYYQKNYYPLDDFYHIDDITNETIDKDISYYLRFHNAAIEMKNKVTFLDFDCFTTSLDYIEKKVGIKRKRDLDLELIKKQMSGTYRKINLPTNNKKELEEIKKQVSLHPRIKECYDIYNKIKG